MGAYRANQGLLGRSFAQADVVGAGSSWSSSVLSPPALSHPFPCTDWALGAPAMLLQRVAHQAGVGFLFGAELSWYIHSERF